MSAFQMCSELSGEDYARNIMLDDLQLAAELGKSLLERNKQLEAVLREHQLVIDDQALEIEYHTKQTRALREAYDSRLKIYEQLDISIQDLERANQRLLLDSSADKKQIRSLKETIDVLEGKCDKLEENIKDLNSQINILKKRLEKNDLDKENTSNRTETENILSDSENGLEDNGAFCPYTKEKGETECTTTKNPVSSTPIRFNGQVIKGWDETDDQSEEMAELLAELSKYRSQCRRGERRIGDLEEQLSTLIRDNTALENQLATLSLRNDEGMKSIHDEIVSLEEVRQGHMCSRCLGNIDNDSEIPGDDDSSMMDELMTSTHRASFSVDVQENHLEFILHRMSVIWIPPATQSILSLFVDFCLYFKNMYLIPLLSKPFRIPFILLHYCIRHKLH